MRMLFIGLAMVVSAVASGCTTAQVRQEPDQGVAVHQCVKNAFMRPVGLFGGAQPEIFLSGPDIRKGPPPAAGSLTRVLNVTGVENLGDPGAEPVIDKCRSWMQPIGDDEVEITILWHNRSCPDSFDEEDTIDCDSRTRFGFSRSDLGEELLGRAEGRQAGIQKLLVVDAYFTEEIQPTARHPEKGVLLPVKSTMHLVVRVMRALPAVDSEAATTADAVCAGI